MKIQAMGLAVSFHILCFFAITADPTKGAGIIPYFRGNEGTYIILGCISPERKHPNQCSDFGGKQQEDEKSFEDTAARKYSEESLEVFTKLKGHPLTQETIRKVLVEQSESITTSFYIKREETQFTYRQYFVRVGHNYTDFFQAFNEKRQTLLAQPEQAEQYLKKSALVIIRTSDLCSLIRTFNGNRRRNLQVKIVASSDPASPTNKKITITRATTTSLLKAYSENVLQNL